jgi:tetratricopeptide (TPR) repeat protein
MDPGRTRPISRARRVQIKDEALQLQASLRADGRMVDEIQDELLQVFRGELTVGEARMYAIGWTVRTAREGLRKLATDDGLDASGLTDREVWRWLRGQVRPREWLPRICRLFQCHQARLGWPAQGNEVAIDFSPSHASSGAALPPASTPKPTAVADPSAIYPVERTAGTNQTRDWTAWFSMRLAQLLALVDQWSVDADSCIPLQLLLHQEVLMFDAVGPSGQDQHYDLSRRQLLLTLVALPVAFAAGFQSSTASFASTARFLSYCAASITASWHLLKQRDLAVVEENVSAYLLGLAGTARRPSRYQAEAARLASQAYRLLGIVALHRTRLRSREYFFEQAVLYADIADDPAMQASALISLGSTPLLYTDQPHRAAELYRRALAHEGAIHPLQRSRIYAELAVALAAQREDRDALRYLDKAQEAYPARPELDPSFVYAEFTPASFILDRGLAYLTLARQFPANGYEMRAWDTFHDLGRVAGSAAIPQRIQVEIVNQQAATAVEVRDLDLFTRHLEMGIAGARALQSDQRRREAMAAWQRALAVWPGERRVRSLAQLFSDVPTATSADDE